jgi:hypothetical protein
LLNNAWISKIKKKMDATLTVQRIHEYQLWIKLNGHRRLALTGATTMLAF